MAAPFIRSGLNRMPPPDIATKARSIDRAFLIFKISYSERKVTQIKHLHTYHSHFLYFLVKFLMLF